MSRSCHMYEQMAPISLREAAHYSTYRSSATRVNLQKAHQQGTAWTAANDA